MPDLPSTIGLVVSLTPLLIGPLACADAQEEYDSLRHELLQGVVRGVLADADLRTSLLATDHIAGWDGHFFLQSADGNFRLEASGQIQSQYIYNHRDDSLADDSRGGFQNRRLKVSFGGHLVDPSLEYKASVDLTRAGGSGRLSDGYIAKTFENDIRMRIGQFKPPFLYEVLMSSSRQLAADRSLIANQRDFDQNRTLGIELSSRGDRLGWALMYHQGFDTDRTTALAEDTEYAASGRLDYLAAGTWNQFRDFSSWRGESFGARFGAAFSVEENEYGTAAGPEVRRFAWTIDTSLDFGGATLFGAFIGLHTHTDGAEDFDRYGALVQGGLFITDDVEVFARYEWADLDESGVAGLSVLTVGFNRFFNRHSLKWTTDIGYGFNEIDARLAVDRAGWLADASGEDGQIVVRTQIQLLF